MSPGELADRTIGSVIGAGDTTRHLLFSCVLCVALAPEVKAKLEEEQLQVRVLRRRQGLFSTPTGQ